MKEQLDELANLVGIHANCDDYRVAQGISAKFLAIKQNVKALEVIFY